MSSQVGHSMQGRPSNTTGLSQRPPGSRAPIFRTFTGGTTCSQYSSVGDRVSHYTESPQHAQDQMVTQNLLSGDIEIPTQASRGPTGAE
ncbi:hypothetical protein C2S52_000666 [Perilla frutescens var. hirtella]|nr:hypothetical protein C2S52_000666 [Perilla frutescens var. hirtella]